MTSMRAVSTFRPTKCTFSVMAGDHRTKEVPDLISAIALARNVSRRKPGEIIQLMRTCDEVKSSFMNGEPLRLGRSMPPEFEGLPRKRRKKRKKRK